MYIDFDLLIVLNFLLKTNLTTVPVSPSHIHQQVNGQGVSNPLVFTSKNDRSLNCALGKGY